MKKILACLTVLISVLVQAQSDVTQFLGIPVDGSKPEMIRKLKAKGFKDKPYADGVLNGTFNGYNVNLHIGTNGDKVCRIMLCDESVIDESSIKIRFNNLCNQFENNGKYFSFVNSRIPDDEDISYEMAVNAKRYEAIFYQHGVDFSDSTAMMEKYLPLIHEIINEEGLDYASGGGEQKFIERMTEVIMMEAMYKPVWFMISQYSGKYYISMFYDNEYNRANGEDL